MTSGDHAADATATLRRYVILRHVTPDDSVRESHWDLMIEHGDALATWAFSTEPFTVAAQDAEQLPDHRRHYLRYEGPIQGDRGTVVRRDEGWCKVIQDEPSCWRVYFPERETLLTLTRQSPACWSACFVGNISIGGK